MAGRAPLLASRGICAVLCLLVSWGAPASAASVAAHLELGPPVRVTAAAPAKGKLLVADRGLRGGIFTESVILLVDHGPEGSMGLIINRPSPIKLSDVLPSREDVEKRGDGLWLGGPVQPTRIMLLARAHERLLDGVPVFDEVQLVITRRGLDRAFGMGIPPAALRAYSGYAGWAPGQLDGEIERGDWHVVPAEVKTVFSQEPEDIWESLVEKSTGRWVRGRAPTFPTFPSLCLATHMLTADARRLGKVGKVGARPL